MPSAWAQLVALNRKLTINQKLSLLALGTVIFFGILSFVYLLNRDQYQLLVSGMKASDVNEVVERLHQVGIPYQLSRGGELISVPTDRLDEARLEIASQGLPQGGGRIGFEIFDQTSWTMTDFTEQVNYRRALEGELEKTILTLSEISQARVHLVLTQESLFIEERQPAKASVVIKIRSGSNLASNRVRSIANLVAYGVEGLAPENVTVVDANGNMLSVPPNESQALESVQLELRRRIEQELAEKVVSTLEPLVGKDKVRASSSVVLDYRETEETEEIFDPERTVVLSQQRTEDQSFDSARQPGGVPGTGATEDEKEDQEVVDQRLRKSEMTNYEVSKTVRHVKSPKGTIERISIAVVVDDKVEMTTNAEGESIKTAQPRSSEEMDQLRVLASAAVGFDEKRGDELTVQNISFQETPAAPPNLTEETLLEQLTPLIPTAMKYLTALGLFALFYLMIFRPVKRKVFASLDLANPELAQLPSGAAAGEHVHQLNQQQTGALGGGSQAALEAGDVAGPLGERHAALKRQLVEISRKEPSTVSQVIKTWLAQDE